MEKYEQPLPILSANVNTLEIETRDSTKGQIKIKNTGGGVLRGRVLSRCAGLTFEPCEFEGNSEEIGYTFDAQVAGLGIGETLSSRFFITSNGGEAEISVNAKLIRMSISTTDGHTIANIRDFYEYSLTHTAQARRLFTDSEFYMLLLASGYEFMEVYESLHKDSNRERAMDNFFILSGLKGRTELEIIGEKRREFSQRPGDSAQISDVIQVKKSDAGYVETPLMLRGAAPWLKLSPEKLTSTDFDSENIATVNFTIDPAKIKSPFACEQILVGESEAEISYRRLPPLTARLSRATYRFADRGAIEITNNTHANMQVGVFCPEKFISFAAQSFPIGANGEIPFEIKLSKFLSAQRIFRKIPFMQTTIEITAKIPGKEIKKKLPIIVGEW